MVERVTEATDVMDEDAKLDDLVDELVSKYRVRIGSTNMPQAEAHTEGSDAWRKVTKNVETSTRITISIGSVSTSLFKPNGCSVI